MTSLLQVCNSCIDCDHNLVERKQLGEAQSPVCWLRADFWLGREKINRVVNFEICYLLTGETDVRFQIIDKRLLQSR